MYQLLLVREVAVLIASAAGAYTDWKTGYIYDWITMPLIAFGVLANIIEQNYFGLALGAAIFGAGYIIYYTGKVGGGDVKMYAGIALALPEMNGSPFVLTAMVYGALSALVFISAYFTIGYARKGIDWAYNKEGIVKAFAMATAFLLYATFATGIATVSKAFILLFAVPVLFGCLFIAFEKGIKNEFFLKKIKVSGLEDDEVIATDFLGVEEMDKIRKSGLGLKGVIGENEKKKLEQEGIKEIPVYRDLPRLGPFIFIGCVLAMAMPNILELAIFGALT